jgi:hypothetical protein
MIDKEIIPYSLVIYSSTNPHIGRILYIVHLQFIMIEDGHHTIIICHHTYCCVTIHLVGITICPQSWISKCLCRGWDVQYKYVFIFYMTTSPLMIIDNNVHPFNKCAEFNFICKSIPCYTSLNTSSYHLQNKHCDDKTCRIYIGSCIWTFMKKVIYIYIISLLFKIP